MAWTQSMERIARDVKEAGSSLSEDQIAEALQDIHQAILVVPGLGARVRAVVKDAEQARATNQREGGRGHWRPR